MGDLDAAFDGALHLEETHLDEGWEDGLRCASRGLSRAPRRATPRRVVIPPLIFPSD